MTPAMEHLLHILDNDDGAVVLAQKRAIDGRVGFWITTRDWLPHWTTVLAMKKRGWLKQQNEGPWSNPIAVFSLTNMGRRALSLRREAA